MKYVVDSRFNYKLNTPAYEASFKNVEEQYIYACKNDGKCRAIRFKKETGEEFVNLGPIHTHRKAVRVTNEKLEYADILVCNECFLPVNSTAAQELNVWLGIVILDDIDSLMADLEEYV